MLLRHPYLSNNYQSTMETKKELAINPTNIDSYLAQQNDYIRKSE